MMQPQAKAPGSPEAGGAGGIPPTAGRMGARHGPADTPISDLWLPEL